MQLDLPSEQSSYWLEGFREVTYPPLKGEVEADVAIIGGGIAGLTTAYLLKKAGLHVAVIEKNAIGSGTTGGTTGKVTTQHGLIYARLTRQLGHKRARLYAAAARQAFDDTRQLILAEKIDCDWRPAASYVYTADPTCVRRFRLEALAAERLGLPASFESRLELPFQVEAAVKFGNQARFHSLKYLRGLARAVDGNGSYVFENSNVTKVRHGHRAAIGNSKGKVRAYSVVAATKVPPRPLIGRLTYAGLEYPETSYIVAARYDGDLRDMYISPDKQHYSLLPLPEAGLLLIGGRNHVPGLGRSEPRYRQLAAYGQRQFGVSDIAYRWKAMDYQAYDELPLAGHLYPWSDHFYFLGGFRKWGLNLSMMAATVIRDLILGQPNPMARLLTPQRWSAPLSFPLAAGRYLEQSTPVWRNRDN